MKNHIILTLIILFFNTLIINSQNVEFKKQKLFDISTINITNISFQNNLCYVKTKDSLFIFMKDGKIKMKMKENEKYNCFVNEKLYSISNNTISDEFNKKVIEIPIEYLKNKTTKFLTFSNNNFYSCIYDTTKWYYSNCISILKNESKPIPYTDLVGVPSGLFSDGKYLWYLYNNNTSLKELKESNGMLRKYDIKTGILIREYELPVITPIGISVYDNCLYTYSTFTKEFIQLTINDLNL